MDHGHEQLEDSVTSSVDDEELLAPIDVNWDAQVDRQAPAALGDTAAAEIRRARDAAA